MNLAWADPVENEAHKLLHGTRPLGERHHGAKLSADDVRLIRSEAANGPLGTKALLAKHYGITKTTVSDICSRRSWQHI